VAAQNPQDLIGQQVVGNDGGKLGKVDNVLVDQATGEPEFISVRTGLFGMRESIVPLAEATTASDGITVPYDERQLKEAPNFDADHALSQDEEQSLYAHYGLDYGHEHSPTGLPEASAETSGRSAAQTGYDTSGPTTDDAMTRSEERLHVGKETVETGRARLRKHVVTEQVQQTVPVTHEEVRVEHEPITDANAGSAMDGPAISEEEHEVVLHAERPVVAKEAVPVERVRLTTDEVTDEAEVAEDVRREEITTDGAYPNEPSREDEFSQQQV